MVSIHSFIPFVRRGVGNNFLIKRRYLIEGGENSQLGSGTYGRVYAGRCIETGHGVAVKVDKRLTGNHLQREADFMMGLFESGVKVPQIYYAGKQSRLKVVVMDLLGPTMDDVMQLVCQYKPSGARQFTLVTVLVLTIRMLDILKGMHIAGIVHRDIKPQNFIFTLDPRANELCIIDFGLSRKWDAAARPVKTKAKMVGTPRFASINAHRGVHLSFGDDLESMAYVAVYLARGTLPWWDVDAETMAQGFETMRKKKQTMTGHTICEGLPAEFGDLIDYARKLPAGEQPEYAKLRAWFRSLLVANLGTGMQDLALVQCDWSVFSDQ